MAATLFNYLFPNAARARKIAQLEFAEQEALLRFAIGEFDQFKLKGELIAINRQKLAA